MWLKLVKRIVKIFIGKPRVGILDYKTDKIIW